MFSLSSLRSSSARKMRPQSTNRYQTPNYSRHNRPPTAPRASSALPRSNFRGSQPSANLLSSIGRISTWQTQQNKSPLRTYMPGKSASRALRESLYSRPKSATATIPRVSATVDPIPVLGRE
eukprot:gnl/Dysnectes_brevis/17314_a43614_61.p1 GENE.gnl/Dysnectes_brevis/17314_a43614_61~~gnl/Dysnectes_brevis/17314_a43614_61.p1  ORF type:complete len:122 (+),score=3.20 gnl/Dysnectes_brevis/17314_a43614_61:69-434(+)